MAGPRILVVYATSDGHTATVAERITAALEAGGATVDCLPVEHAPAPIGYDAVVHQGAYTRDLWYRAVGATERAVDEAKRVGERAPDEPPRSQMN